MTHNHIDIKNKPKVTVLMPVYNGEHFLAEAMKSITNQTFTDFEFLIINDGSTDRSHEVASSFKDHRIRVVSSTRNEGLIAALNKGLALAQGEYIARMDQDDISLPQRLEKQVAFMDKNPNIGILGTWVKTFGSIKETIWEYPEDPHIVKSRLLFESVLAHPSTMLRRKILIDHNLYYNKDYIHAEDYELWVRCSRYTDLSNIPEVLLLYRFHDNKIGSTKLKEQLATAEKIRFQQLKNFALTPSAEEMELHNRISRWELTGNRDFIKGAHQWLIKLKTTNADVPLYPEPAFSRVLADRWFAVCSQGTEFGFWTWKTFWGSPLCKETALSLTQKIKFAIKCGMSLQRKYNE